MFLSSVIAADPTTSQSSSAQSNLMSFVPLILIFAIFYFLLIRPQQKKMKIHQGMVKNLKIGNKICTSSGIFGTIKDIGEKENFVDLEIANNVIIKILRNSISEVILDEKEKMPEKKKEKKSKK